MDSLQPVPYIKLLNLLCSWHIYLVKPAWQSWVHNCRAEIPPQNRTAETEKSACATYVQLPGTAWMFGI